MLQRKMYLPLIDEAIELLTDFEVELHFHRPDSKEAAYLRDLVLWLKTGLPAVRFASTQDGKSLYELARYFMTIACAPEQKLVEHAINQTSFSSEGTGIQYYDCWSDYDEPESGRNVDLTQYSDMQRNVLISYWVGGFSEVLMPESIYLKALKDLLYEKLDEELLIRLMPVCQSDFREDTLNEQLTTLAAYLADIQSQLLFMPVSEVKRLPERVKELEQKLSTVPLTEKRPFGHVGSFELW